MTPQRAYDIARYPVLCTQEEIREALKVLADEVDRMEAHAAERDRLRALDPWR
jgi:hypothetical protein